MFEPGLAGGPDLLTYGLFGDDDAFGGDDVPEVFGDYVDCNEIEVSALVTAAVRADVAFVATWWILLAHARSGRGFL